jgi:general secretion pathway protein A
MQQDSVLGSAMYNGYFGLAEEPFSIAPDPRFLYMSEQHREALAHLLFGVSSNGGFILLTGEVGTGKTTVCRCLLEQLPEQTEVALILNPKYSVKELLSAICDDLGVGYSQSSEMKDYVDALNQHLLENHRNNRHTVLIIDEAQNLSADVLETIRLLTNLETNTQKLLQVILIGQPELLALLERPELRQLNQRITARYHLRALRQDELAGYVSHRLSIAGLESQLFPEATLKRLYELTKGIPRLVNIICDRALLGTYVEREDLVHTRTLGKAASEVFGEGTQTTVPHDRSFGRLAVLVVLILFIVGAAFTLQGRSFLGQKNAPEAVEPQPAMMAEESPAPDSAAPAETELEGINAAPQEPERPELSNPSNWHWQVDELAAATQVLAYQDLLRLWGVSYNPRENPSVCRFADSQGLRCLFSSSGLDDLVSLNRPAVLSLFNPQGQKYFATLVSMQDDLAEVKLAGHIHWVRLEDLQLWLDGQSNILWRKPDAYTDVLDPGSTGPMIAWLDKQLAAIQGRLPLSQPPEVYDDSLVRQVRRFQSSKGLRPDGAVGPRTVIQINNVTLANLPLLLEPGAGE